MAKTNTRPTRARTHEGAPAKRINAELALRRAVLACLLWEDSFYESGQDVAERIGDLVPQIDPQRVADLAAEARNRFNLRHAPLLLTSALANCQHDHFSVRSLVPQVVRRADELAELVAIHCCINGVGPDRAKKVLGAQLKRGLAEAFHNFDAYQLAKYNRDGAIKLRDVLFMVHAKPRTPQEAEDYKRLVDGTLATPDTWETALSAGGEKRAEFERLLRHGKLGYLALLRNLRNMVDAGVDRDLVRQAIRARKGAGRVLPFRYVAAARHAPSFEPDLDFALQAAIAEMPALTGTTVVLVDVSISMGAALSRKSDLNRADAAATLASITPAEDRRVFTFTDEIKEAPARAGISGIDAIKRNQRPGGTMLGHAVRYINKHVPHDRLIVITDEQSHDPVPDPVAERAYMLNVASYRNGVGYGAWRHIDGFSEGVLRYILAVESDGV